MTILCFWFTFHHGTLCSIINDGIWHLRLFHFGGPQVGKTNEDLKRDACISLACRQLSFHFQEPGWAPTSWPSLPTWVVKKHHGHQRTFDMTWLLQVEENWKLKRMFLFFFGRNLLLKKNRKRPLLWLAASVFRKVYSSVHMSKSNVSDFSLATLDGQKSRPPVWSKSPSHWNIFQATFRSYNNPIGFLPIKSYVYNLLALLSRWFFFSPGGIYKCIYIYIHHGESRWRNSQKVA